MSDTLKNHGLDFLKSFVKGNNEYIFEIDEYGNPIIPEIVLSRRNGQKINVIQNINNFRIFFSVAESFEISFDVEKICDNTECEVWEELTDFKLAYIPYYDLWFEIYVTIKDENSIQKSISGVQLQTSELSQIMLYGTDVNSEDDLEAHDYEPTVLYDPRDQSKSLLDRILQKAPHYSVYHVDESLMNIQRIFSWDDTSIMDAFDDISTEIDCLFVFGEGSKKDGSITRTVSVYDMESYCPNCGNRGDFDNGICPECLSDNTIPGYGKDTNVFITTENLAESFASSNDTDNSKNCFHLAAGDDLMTATIINCNPNGTSYIWYVTDDMRKDMSTELQQALEKYDEAYEYYSNKHIAQLNPNTVDKYNELIAKYSIYDEELEGIGKIVGYTALTELYYNALDFASYLKTSLMPTKSSDQTSAKEQISKLTLSSMSPIGVTSLSTLSVATADTQVKNYAKVYVDTSKYAIEVSNSTLANKGDGTKEWHGKIIVASFTDEKDTADKTLTITFNDDAETYIKQSIDKLLNKDDTEALGVVDIFKLEMSQFKAELKKYSYDYLHLLYDCCQDAINILIENGISDKENDLYNGIYLPYIEKNGYIEEEMNLRQQEVLVVDNPDDNNGIVQLVKRAMTNVNDTLNLEGFLGELWVEFISFRRESSYENANYISEGLTNKELIEQARLYIKAANNELKKSATLQHQISAPLKNLLAIPEFKPFADNFRLGNWIRVKVDGTVYKMRLTSYTIDFNSFDNISVEFTDIMDQSTLISNVVKTFKQSKSTSSEYTGSVNQAVNDTTNIIYGNTGILIKSSNEIDGTTTETRILASGIYQSSDGWVTTTNVAKITEELRDEFTEIINNSTGLYTTAEVQEDGSTIYYMHDKPTLEESTIVWKMTKDAWGVSTNGGESWNAGVTVDGNTIMNIIAAEGLNANWITSGSISAEFVRFGDQTLTNAMEDLKQMSVILSNDFQTFATDADGNYNSPLNIETTINVYYASQDITTDENTEITVECSEGLTGTYYEASHTAVVTDLTTDEGYILFTVKYKDFIITKKFTVTKLKQGENGGMGVGIASIVEYYAVSSSDTEIPTSWQTAIPQMTAQNKYLWNYEEITYTDGSSADMGKRVIGMYSQDGVGVQNVDVMYYKSNSSSELTGGSWTTEAPQWEKDKYIWSKTVITYTNQITEETVPVCTTGAHGSDGKGIVSIVEQYYKSTSSTELQGGQWSGTYPGWEDGKYIWTRSITTYTDNTTSTTTPICVTGSRGETGLTGLQGKDGKDGLPGKDGTNSFTHIAYANSSDGQTDFSVSDSDRIYIGMYVDSNIEDSSDPTKYKWSKVRGEDGVGIPGTPGKDGKTPYLHIAYANSNDGTVDFSTTQSQDKLYIGQYTDFVEADSNTPSDYAWSKIKGDTGVGIQSIENYYLTTSKSSGVTISTSGWSETPIATTVINKYLWNYEKIIYTDGSTTTTTPLIIGTHGTSGTGISSIKEYYAVGASNTTPPSSWQETVPTTDVVNKYLWNYEEITYTSGETVDLEKRIIGMYSQDGKDGVGIQEIINYYLTTSLSEGVTINTSGWATTPSSTSQSKRYLWNYEVVKYTNGTESKTIPHIIGTHGLNGDSSLSAVLDNEYQAIPVAADGSYTSLGTVKSTITIYNGTVNITNISSISVSVSGVTGVLSGDTYTVDSLNDDIGQVIFTATYNGNTLTKTFHIAKIYNGENATRYSLDPSTNAIKISNSNALSPSTYVLNSYSLSGSSTTINDYSGRYIIEVSTNGESWTKVYTSSQDEHTKTISLEYNPSSTTITNISSNKLVLPSNATLIRTTLYATGGTTTMLDRETTIIVKDGVGDQMQSITYYYLATSLSSGVTTGNVGWTTTIQNVTSEKKYLWSYSSMVFSLSGTYKSNPVIIGTYGEAGVGIQSLTEYYAVNNSTTTAPTSWSTTVPQTSASNRYLWNYEQVIYTDGSSEDLNKRIIGMFSKDGSNGVGIQSITNYYLTTSASSGVTTSTSGWSTTITPISSTKKYLWNYEVIKYTNGNSTTTVPHIIGTYGAEGIGIIQVAPLYYSSSSNSTPDSPDSVVTLNKTGHTTTSEGTTIDTSAYNVWNLAIPYWTTTYPYYFTCSQVLYSDGTYKWSTVSQNRGLEAANQAAIDAQTAAGSLKGELEGLQQQVQDTTGQLTDQMEDLTDKVDSNYGELSDRIDSAEKSTNQKYQDSIDYANKILNDYKDELSNYMTFSAGNGLVLGSVSPDGSDSGFQTVIDSTSLKFKQDDNVVAYITNNQLYITSAIIESTLTIGNFFFSERSDGSVSLTWHGD